ncbi:MAG: PP2C family protein-serine/threonine phosphatase [Armatimonadota bacterium]
MRRERAFQLLEMFEVPIIGGRWLLVAAAAVETVLVYFSETLSTQAITALVLLAIYSAISLVAVHRLDLRRVPLGLMLLLDLVFVALVAEYTGRAHSPFLGQYFLIIFAGALFYGLRGGVLVGSLASVATLILAWRDPGGMSSEIRDLVPYFPISGLFTGYLVDRLRASVRRYQETLDLTREADVREEGVRRDMKLARRMQEATLPKALPQRAPFEIAARFEPAREVGGDFYQFLQSEQVLGVVIGDVAGKGVQAALASTSIGHLFPWLRPLDDPARALEDLNRDLVERLPREAFASLTLAELLPEPGVIRLWNAGHPPAMLWSAGTKQVSEAQVFNLLLGIAAERSYTSETLPFGPGDVLLLYSDGLIEAPNERGEQFETERVAECLSGSAGEPAEAIAESLIRAVTGWGTVIDDLTVVVVKHL